MLTVADVTIHRSGAPVVRGVSLDVRPGEVVALLGINGAGKTTLLEGISGIVPLQAGRIQLNGSDITKWSTSRRARAGLAHIEEGRSVFPALTTTENLRVGLPRNADWREAFELFPELEKRKDVAAGLLSGGEQQMLVVARAWFRDPHTFLFDELSVGLAPLVVNRLLSTIRTLADRGKAVLLVEQYSGLALGIADRAAVMRHGELVFSGDASTLADDPERLQSLYLGGGAEEEAA